jgi:hypothetical protein
MMWSDWQTAVVAGVFLATFAIIAIGSNLGTKLDAMKYELTDLRNHKLLDIRNELDKLHDIRGKLIDINNDFNEGRYETRNKLDNIEQTLLKADTASEEDRKTRMNGVGTARSSTIPYFMRDNPEHRNAPADLIRASSARSSRSPGARRRGPKAGRAARRASESPHWSGEACRVVPLAKR